MKYGRFSKLGDEFVITRPDTPKVWENQFGNAGYGVTFSQTGGGLALSGEKHHFQLTQYFPRFDQPGRYVYLHDHDGGDTWTINHAPVCRPYDAWQCTHGPGYSRIEQTRAGIAAELTVFVPLDEPVELWTIRIVNRSRKTRRLTAFPYVEWLIAASGSGIDDIGFAAASDCHYEPATCSAVATARLRHSHFSAFMSADYRPSGHDCNRNHFVGGGRTLTNPIAVERGRCTNSVAIGEVTVAALSRRLTLRPGAERTLHVMIGMAETRGQRAKLRRKFFRPGGVRRAFARVADYWRRQAEATHVATPDGRLDRMFNFWTTKHVYQLAVSNTVRRFTRGFRDHLQDAMGMVWLDPAVSRAILVEAMGAQYAGGDAIRRWPANVEGRGLVHRAMDLKFWLVLATAAYLKHTADFAVLDERRPFHDSKRRTTLLERLHLVAETGLRQLGRHGLSLIGEGDWNDGLSGMGPKGESVWLAEAMVLALRELAELCQRIGEAKQAKRYAARAEEVARRINRLAWNGDWYVQAFDAAGRPVGSRRNREGQVYLMPQTWAVMAGIASPVRRAKLFRVIDRDLDTEFGPLVMKPAYTKGDPAIGHITYAYPGMSENASIYCHAAAFKMFADGLAGRGDALYDTWTKLMPYSHDADRTRGEPYILGNLYWGPGTPENFGLTSRTWQTSTPNWLLKSIVEGLFGLRPGYDALEISPSIPAKWRHCAIRARVGGETFDVTVRNPDGVQSGVAAMKLDGAAAKGNRVPLRRDGGSHAVEVTLGNR